MCASKPWMIVTRSFSIRSRLSSGSKLRVTICRAPVTNDIHAPSDRPKAWKSGR